MTNERITRKIDNLGRVVIPKHLRDKAGIGLNGEVLLSSTEENGKFYICLSAFEEVQNPNYAIAKQVLEELGIEVPEQLKDF